MSRFLTSPREAWWSPRKVVDQGAGLHGAGLFRDILHGHGPLPPRLALGLVAEDTLGHFGGEDAFVRR